MSNTVAILDAGAQYGKVIDRRIRELGIETKMLPLDTDTDSLKEFGAIVISGGPESVYGANAPEYNPEIFNLGIPIFGICYGMQLINYVHQGTVEKKSVREDGQFDIFIETTSELFNGMDATQSVLLTHGDTVDQVPEGFGVIAKSGDLIAGIESRDKKMYGVQFHPEVDLTINGMDVFKNFLFGIAGLEATFTVEDREADAIKYLQETIENKNALILLSGGVDSTVTAALLKKAIPAEQIYAIHVDHGLMRKDESKKVVESLESLGLNIKLVNAGETFANATTIVDGIETKPLCKATIPEHKRKIIGDTFVKVAEAAVASFNLKFEDTVLVQGTLRPDLIESASKVASAKAETIKTHHNDTQLIRDLRDNGQVAEPLQEYHKDEVRKLGVLLGLPEALVWRQPFPGPGLGVRVLCTDAPYLEKYDQIYQDLQTFATDQIKVTLLPVQTVGVQGDGRTYSYVVGLSTATDNPTADEWLELRRLALEIPKVNHQVNRIVYIFGEYVDGPVKEITPTKLDVPALDLLREADATVNDSLYKNNLIKAITQVPVVLVPLPFDTVGGRAVAIRTFLTNDFMTGVPAIPGEQMPVDVLNQMVADILKIEGISKVFYDLTSKPPGTTEWE